MKTKDLSGEALNYAVCVAENNGGKLSTEGTEHLRLLDMYRS